MLTAAKKAFILAQAGIDVPRCPDIDGPANVHQNHDVPSPFPASNEFDVEPTPARIRWNQEIEILFVTYTAARAAKSLREAEEARQIDILRRASNRLR